MIRVLFIDCTNPEQRATERFRPLWPAFLSAYAEKHLGPDKFEFRLMKGELEDELTAFKYHLVALSSVSVNYNYAMEYASIAKNFGVPVIIGGIHISAMPHCLTEDMDVGCIGEGEETFLELMRHYLKYDSFSKKDLREIKGIVFYDNGQLVKTTARPVPESMDQIPHPNRSLTGYQRTDTMLTARGCPYRCVFCSVSRYWGKVRFASSEYVLEEIGELVDNGVKIIKIFDDLFTSNKKRLKEISESIIAKGYHRKVKFTCWCSANTITPDVAKALRDMSIIYVELGLESGCDRTLKYLKGKNFSVKQNSRAIKFLKDQGIRTNAYFIIGAPEETREEMLETYNFIKSSALDTVTLNLLTPLPGTPIWNYAIEHKLVSDTMDWSRLDESVVLSKTLSQEELSLIHGKFKRLCFIKRLKAMPRSPWLRELPRVGLKKLRGILALKRMKKERMNKTVKKINRPHY
jgi:radical SAM superfamily enzyme YgiQ (UPF0313 family)